MADLVVDLYGTRVGALAVDSRTFDFESSREAVEAFGIDSPVLSVAIPLTVVSTRARKERRRNFFRELLPEGRMLRRLAREARLAEQDTIGLIRRYGRDVAGALQIWDPGVPGEPREPRLEPLTTAGVARLLTSVQDYPLGNAPNGGKSSLAGVQDKIVLVRDASGWSQALDGHPTTHILKPPSREHPTVIYDEEYGSRFTRAAGLAAFDVRIDEFDGHPAAVIERYDRSPSAPQGRIHQEDFNQVLGESGDQKYQRYGGTASLARVAKVVAEYVGPAALERLLRMVVLSVAVGNLDMHAKNIALLHHPDGEIALAPAYDFVPQVHQRNDGELALAVDGEFRHAAITRSHLTREGMAWGVEEAEEIVVELLVLTEEVVANEEPHPGAYRGLANDISRFVSNLRAGRAAGDT